MIYRVTILLSLLFFVLSALPGDVMADRKRLKKPSERSPSSPAKISDSKYFISINGSFGSLVGQSTKSAYLDNVGLLLYGGGITAEYFFKRKVAIQIEYSRTIKPLGKTTSIRISGPGVGLFYRFTPEKSNSLYFRGLAFYYQSGRTRSSTYRAYPDHLGIKVGIGAFRYTSSSLNWRFELIYNRLFIGNTIRDSFVTIDHALEAVTASFGLGLPL